MDLKKLNNFLKDKKVPGYRQKQIEEWVFRKGVFDFEKMTNLSKDLREEFSSHIFLLSLKILTESHSSDFQTSKYVLELEDGKVTEMVIMRHEKGRKTVCISCQVGCPVGCVFCATGKLGLLRQLTVEEIVDQVVLARSILIKESRESIGEGSAVSHHVPTNVVFMGMGEPFLNYNRVIESIKIMHDKMELGGRRVTLSTSGVASRIYDFADLGLQANLAISLHSAVPRTREKLVPLTEQFSLEELGDAIGYYQHKTNKKIFYEYVMIDGVNDSVEDARAVLKWLPSPLSHINLIPYNMVEGVDFKSSTKKNIESFKRVIEKGGVPVTIRHTMGDDIGAACGQLAGKENGRKDKI